MTRPRPDAIDPLVPEMPTATYRTDGGERVSTATAGGARDENDAPLVPDLSH
jgi:hypothetical protein